MFHALASVFFLLHWNEGGDVEVIGLGCLKIHGALIQFPEKAWETKKGQGGVFQIHGIKASI